ncbi:hypothetical protein SH139x_004147 [Planctomycetaceae bacterium SH139]
MPVEAMLKTHGQPWPEGCPWEAQGEGLHSERWYGVVSSRLGLPVEKQSAWFQDLERVAWLAARRGAALLVADGTAAAEWVREAACLYQVPTVELVLADPARRDEAIVQLSDSLFALRVRRGGTVSRCLQRRLLTDPEHVWVVVGETLDDGAKQLIEHGAIRWQTRTPPSADATARDVPASSHELLADRYQSAAERYLPTAENNQSSGGELRQVAKLWSPPAGLEQGDWLVHCTRARSGPLPGQTRERWRREVLLRGTTGRAWPAAEVLAEIIRRRTVRGAAVRRCSGPVVCLAAVGLRQLLARRTFRPHRSRWDYEPYGLAISREALQRIGGQPVVYAESLASATLPKNQRWRFQPIGKTYDWRAEQEWRVPGSLDLSQFAAHELVVFAGDLVAAEIVAPLSPWPVILMS